MDTGIREVDSFKLKIKIEVSYVRVDRPTAVK